MGFEHGLYILIGSHLCFLLTLCDYLSTPCCRLQLHDTSRPELLGQWMEAIIAKDRPPDRAIRTLRDDVSFFLLLKVRIFSRAPDPEAS